MLALAALIAVTAVWGVTFVQVKDAVDVYPLFAFLAVRYAIAAGVLGLAGAPRVRSLGRPGLGAGAVIGVLGAVGIGLQTAGLHRTTVSSTLAVLIQVWAQRRMSAARIALVFALETVWAGIFGYWLSGDRLGWLGWGGCAAILAGIVLAEPAAVNVLRRMNLLSSD